MLASYSCYSTGDNWRTLDHTPHGDGPGEGPFIIDNDWVQVGYDLDGEAPQNIFGFKVSLSKDGSVLVVSVRGYNGSTGRVYTYEIIKS